MNLNLQLLETLKILVFSSVFFVWVVRYQNIIEEFRAYNYPNWLRDIVGILKLSFVGMLLNSNTELVKAGCTGIVILMLAAIITHLKVKNPFGKMIPSITLLSICAFIFIMS